MNNRNVGYLFPFLWLYIILINLALIDDFKRGHPRKTGSGEVFEHPSEEQFEHSTVQMRPREKSKHYHPIEPEHDHPTEVIDDQFIFGTSSSDKYEEEDSAKTRKFKLNFQKNLFIFQR